VLNRITNFPPYQFVPSTWEVPKATREVNTHDEWCSLNADEPYVTWMEENEQRGGATP
jgi:hypothetical protein